jgi:hypothetical protein
MGTAYTPGLTVSPQTVIRRQRRLPLKGEVLVQQGQIITPDVVVARALLPGIMQSVKVAGMLGIEPDDLTQSLLVKTGDIVEKGQVLAKSKALFGLIKSECKSPVAGAVETISTVSGNVGIRQEPIPIEVKAYISGRVAEVTAGEGVVMEADGALVQGIFGVGGERVGVLQTVAGSPDDVLTEAQITPDMAGKILVGGANMSGAALARASQVGVTGIIAGGIIDKDLIAFLGYDIGVAITGHENINITLVITEGFGTIPMAQRTFDLLKSLEGKTGSINGATQIRAGVIRPELIVPIDSSPRAAAVASHAEEDFSLDIGSHIRVIREPYFGLLGEVTALPSQLVTVDSGASVRVLETKLHDGRTVTVPRANVEIIQTG